MQVMTIDLALALSLTIGIYVASLSDMADVYQITGRLGTHTTARRHTHTPTRTHCGHTVSTPASQHALSTRNRRQHTWKLTDTERPATCPLTHSLTHPSMHVCTPSPIPALTAALQSYGAPYVMFNAKVLKIVAPRLIAARKYADFRSVWVVCARKRTGG